MPVSADDLIEGLKFCAKAAQKTKHWACQLLFIRPKEIFVWDGEQGARYPLPMGVEVTMQFDDVLQGARKLRDLGEKEINFNVNADGYVHMNDCMAGTQFTEFARMPELDKKWSIELTECGNFVNLLRVVTQCLNPPKYMNSAVIVSEEAAIACDGVTAFYADNRNEFPMYRHKWNSGKAAAWLGWRFCQVLGRNDAPERIRVSPDTVTACWEHGGELMSTITRSDKVSDRVAAFTEPNNRSKACEFEPMRKWLVEEMRNAAGESIGVHTSDGGENIGFEVAGKVRWSAGGITDGETTASQFYLDYERLRRILQYATAYDTVDFHKANRKELDTVLRHVRFYGQAPTPFTLAVGVQY